MNTVFKIAGCENLKWNTVHAHVNLQSYQIVCVHKYIAPKDMVSMVIVATFIPNSIQENLPALKFLLHKPDTHPLTRKKHYSPSAHPYLLTDINTSTISPPAHYPKRMRRFALNLPKSTGVIEGVLT